MCTLFGLVHIKKRSFLTSCVFGFVFLNASSQLRFRLSGLHHRSDMGMKNFGFVVVECGVLGHCSVGGSGGHCPPDVEEILLI